MTKYFTSRSVLAFTGLILMVGILSFSDKKSLSEGNECALKTGPDTGKELLWESLSRQFSGSVSTY